MKPPRLSKAQWELLRKLPDSSDGHAVFRLASGEINSARSLVGRGLARMGLLDAWRTPAGCALIEAEDKRRAEEKRMESLCVCGHSWARHAMADPHPCMASAHCGAFLETP